MNKEEDSPNKAVNSLMKFLTPLAEGDLVPEFNAKLRELVVAVQETDKQGAITLSIKLERVKQSRNQIIVHTELKLKKPEQAKPITFYFADDLGGIHRQDPNQMQFQYEKENNQ